MLKKDEIIRDWVILAGALTGYFSVLFFTNKIFPNLNQNSVDNFINILIDILIGVSFLSLLVFLITKGAKSPVYSYISLVIIFLVSIFFLYKVPSTMHRFHFVGYGILSFILYFMLRHYIGTEMLYVCNLLIIMAFALIDEAIQLTHIGGHDFEFSSVTIDWLSGLMAQLLIALVIRPKLEIVSIKIRNYAKGLGKVKNFRNK